MHRYCRLSILFSIRSQSQYPEITEIQLTYLTILKTSHLLSPELLNLIQWLLEEVVVFRNLRKYWRLLLEKELIEQKNFVKCWRK